MGISLEQYRARIGTFGAKQGKSKDCFDVEVLVPPDIDTSPSTMISISWKTASLSLLLILLCALCQSQLLLMGGVEPHPGPTSEETNDKRASVIAELVVKAESKTVKDVLRLYKPKMTQNQLQKTFENVLLKSLIETMTFLGIPDCVKFVKPTIIDKLISNIQSYFPDDCGMCNQEYSVGFGETIWLSCSVCRQGIHNRCLAMKLGVAEIDLEQMTPEDVRNRVNPCGLQTLIYLCAYCHSAAIPSPDAGLKKKKGASKQPKALPATLPSSNDWTDLDSDAPVSRELPYMPAAGNLLNSGNTSHDSSDADSEPDPEDHLPRHRRQSRDKSASHTGDQRKEDKTEDDTSRKQEKPICPFYRKGQCRHGISGKGCAKAHPKLCPKLMSNGTRGPRGCTKGKDCERFHPKMCPSSINYSECLNENCCLYHVKGTRRLNSNSRSQEQPNRNRSKANHQDSHRDGYAARTDSHRDSYAARTDKHRDSYAARTDSQRDSYSARTDSHRHDRDSFPPRMESTHQHSKPVSQEDFLELLRILKREIVEAIRTPPPNTPLVSRLPTREFPLHLY